MLTEKERLGAAMKGRDVDRPPCVCPGGMMNMITRELMERSELLWPAAHSNPALMADLSAASYEYGCFENFGLPFCMTVEAEAMGATVAMGDLDREPHVIGDAIDSVTRWRQLRPLDKNMGRVKVVLDAIRLLKDRNPDVPILGNLTGPVSVAGSVLESTIYYKELRRKKDDAKAFMDFIVDQMLDFGLNQLAAGADAIAISDPSASGEILGPALFREYALPALDRLARGLKTDFPEAGIIIHICGKMHTVLEALGEIPADVFSFDAVVSLAAARERLPGKRLMGNVSTFTLEMGTPEKIAALTRNCLKAADIVSPACGMGTGSPLANVQAMLATVRAFGKEAKAVRA